MPVKKDDTVKSGDDVTVTKPDVRDDAADDAVTDADAPHDNARQDVPNDDAPGALRIRQPRRDRPADAGLDRRRETPPWERDDAPKGSTSESLMTTDENGKTRVAGATHYTHLADGRIVGGYGIGTHHTDADVEDGAPVPVTATFG